MIRLEISLMEVFKAFCKRNVKVTEDTIQEIMLQFLLWFSVQKKKRNPHCEFAGVLMETVARENRRCSLCLPSSPRVFDKSSSPPLDVTFPFPILSLWSCRDLYPPLLLTFYFVSPLVGGGGGEEPQRNRKCCSCKTVIQSPCFRKLRPRFFSFILLLLPPTLQLDFREQGLLRSNYRCHC